MTIKKIDIDKYLAGDKKGKDANRLEREALNDPFLAEAMEGFESFDDDPSLAINEITARLSAKSSNQKSSPTQKPAKKNNNIFLWVLPIAAAVVILFMLVFPSHDKIKVSDDVAISMEIVEPIDIFVPQDLNSKLQQNMEQKMGVSTYIVSDHDTLLITNKQTISIDILMPTN